MTARQRTAAVKPYRRPWTEAEIRQLGTRTDVPTAGSIIGGLCETESRVLYRRGDFPVPVIKVGHRLVVPVAPILAFLGLDGGDGDRSRPAEQQGSGSGAGPGPRTRAAGPAPPGPATTTSATPSPKDIDCDHRTPLRSA